MKAYVDRGPTVFSLPSRRGNRKPRSRNATAGMQTVSFAIRLDSELIPSARTPAPDTYSPPRVANGLASGVPYGIGCVHGSAESARTRTFFEELQLSPRKPSPRARLPKLHGAPGAPFGLGSKANVSSDSVSPGQRSSVTSLIAASEVAEDVPLELLNDVRWILFPVTQVEKPAEVPLSAAQRERGTPEYEVLAQLLRKLRVLRRLSDEDLEPIVCACRLRSYPRYAAILRGGSPGPSCCLLVSGVAASLTKGGSTLVPAAVSKGAVFDEGALVTQVRVALLHPLATPCTPSPPLAPPCHPLAPPRTSSQ